MRKLLLTAAALALALPALAQTPPPAAPAQAQPAPPPVIAPPQGQVAAPTTPLNPTAPTEPTAPSQPPILPGPVAEWRQLDPANALVIDTTKGRIIIEMHPEAAPEHVQRIKQLAAAGFYDRQKFHRVIDWFMSQTGDPLGTGEGQSPYPDLPPEFTFQRDAAMPFTAAAQPFGAQVGFIGALPVQTQPDSLMALTGTGKVRAWGLYCPGVAGMARGEPENSANSQFFLMRQPYPSLEKRYTVWGRVVVGLDVVRAIAIGEPPENPDMMMRVRVMSDIPEADRPKIQIADTRSPVFRARIEAARKAKGADFSVCDIDIPTRAG